MGSELESEDFDTIGALVFGHLGRCPEVGYEIVLDGNALRIEEVDGSRVARLIVREREEDSAGEWLRRKLGGIRPHPYRTDQTMGRLQPKMSCLRGVFSEPCPPNSLKLPWG